MALSTQLISTLRVGAVAALLAVTSGAAVAQVQDQVELATRVETHQPAKEAYVKDQPILGWTITSNAIEDIPAAIRDHLGSVDQTGYTPEYLAENVGTIVALQMTGDGPDFYIIGKPTFLDKYSLVSIDDVIAKNGKLMGRLANLPEVMALVEARGPAIVGALKTTPVEMIRMSAIGYETADEVVIQAPWGDQTKPAGQDAFLAFDTGENQYYMVNQGEDGNPLSYIPAN